MEAEPPAREGEPAEVLSIAGDDDRALLERHHRGDRSAFGAFMKSYTNGIYGYLSRTGAPINDRDDLFQEVFCKVHQASKKNMPVGPVRPWVYRIAVNTVRDHFRRRKVRSIVKLDATTVVEDSEDATAERALEAKQTATFLEVELQKLPLPQREALLLSSVEGLGIQGAAATLGEPPATVKTRVRRARLSLAESMMRRAKSEERKLAQ